MDFGLTTEQQEIKERAAEFADRDVAPGAAERDLNDVYPEELRPDVRQGLHGPLRPRGVRPSRGKSSPAK